MTYIYTYIFVLESTLEHEFKHMHSGPCLPQDQINPNELWQSSTTEYFFLLYIVRSHYTNPFGTVHCVRGWVQDFENYAIMRKAMEKVSTMSPMLSVLILGQRTISRNFIIDLEVPAPWLWWQKKV